MNREQIIKNLEGEVWIENNGYKISNKGRIITKQGRLSQGGITSYGYRNANVVFEDGFVARSAHRAVAHAFINNDDPINKIEVNHIDGNKLNNCVENLEWCTKSENQLHEARVLKQRNCEKHWGTILTEEQVIEIYNLCKERNLLYKEIAELYNIYPQEVSDIAQGKLWKDLNLNPLPKVVRGSRKNGKRGYTENTYKSESY